MTFLRQFFATIDAYVVVAATQLLGLDHYIVAYEAVTINRIEHHLFVKFAFFEFIRVLGFICGLIYWWASHVWLEDLIKLESFMRFITLESSRRFFLYNLIENLYFSSFGGFNHWVDHVLWLDRSLDLKTNHLLVWSKQLFELWVFKHNLSRIFSIL